MKSKRILSLLMAVLLLAAIAAPGVMAGDHTVHIATAEDLRSIAERCRLDAYSEDLIVILDGDIDLSGAPFEPFATFSGTFEGNNHTISGVTLGGNGMHQGFFRYVQESGIIRDLTLEITVDPADIRTNVGGLVGTNFGTVVSCVVNGSVRGQEKVGGIVGENLGKLQGCEFHGVVSGKRYTGGVAGYNSGEIEACLNYGEINTSVETETLALEDISITDINTTALPVVTAEDSNTVSDTGGVAGLNEGTVSDSYNSGTVGYQHFGYNVGGIVGRQSGFVNGCTNYGTVLGHKDVGGIAGQMEPFMILTATASFLDELNEFSRALDTAMNHLKDNSSDTSAAMSDLEGSASGARSNAQTMIENGDYGDNKEEDKDVDWEYLSSTAGNLAAAILGNDEKAITEVSLALGTDTLDRLIKGELTTEDYNKLKDILGGTSPDMAAVTDILRGWVVKKDMERAQKELERIQRESNYNIASGALSGNMGDMADNISRLNHALSNSTGDLAEDIIQVNYHFSRAATILADVFSGRQIIYKDISDDDGEADTDGKIYAGVNSGTVEGDTCIGGIAGDMGFELAYDMEGVLAEEMEDKDLISNTYETRCVVRNCVNNGSVTAKKDNAGGIVGNQEVGLVIRCEAYGVIKSTEGNYVGGVAGRSATVVRSSYALCELSGETYVGGIVGTGERVHDCAAEVSATAKAALGAIAGWVDVHAIESEPAEGEEGETVYAVTGNTFVSSTLGGVDGVSYAAVAEPHTAEEFLTMDSLPDRFRQITVTFDADGYLVKTVSCVYGKALDPNEIPAVPVKEGFTGYWPDYDFTTIYESVSLDAVYVPNQTSLASESLSGDSPMSTLLLEGSFSDCSELTLKPFEGVPVVVEGGILHEAWEYAIVNNQTEVGPHTVHLLKPALMDSHDQLLIYVLDGETWVRINTHTDGSYLVFEDSGESSVFCVVEYPKTTDPIWFIVGIAALVVILVVIILIASHKRRKARRSAGTGRKAKRETENREVPETENEVVSEVGSGMTEPEETAAETEAPTEEPEE